MPAGENFKLIIRQGEPTADEELYCLTILEKVVPIDDLILHPDLAGLIHDRAIRLEKVDSHRFNLFLHKRY